MDVLKNKVLHETDYISRYNVCYQYYNTLDDKYMLGTGYNLLKSTTYFEHKVEPSDTLYALALTYYNNPTYFWVIAYYNNIEDACATLYDNYKTIKIPQISTIQFGDLR